MTNITKNTTGLFIGQKGLILNLNDTNYSCYNDTTISTIHPYAITSSGLIIIVIIIDRFIHFLVYTLYSIPSLSAWSKGIIIIINIIVIIIIIINNTIIALKNEFESNEYQQKLLVEEGKTSKLIQESDLVLKVASLLSLLESPP